MDLGFVGDVESVNPEPIRLLSEKGYIPVIAPVGVGLEGESYNINADAVAGAPGGGAQGRQAHHADRRGGDLCGSRGPHHAHLFAPTEQAHRMIEDGKIAGGMIPKVEACIKALEGGVARTHIIDGRKMHSLLLEIFTDQGIGTMVVAVKEVAALYSSAEADRVFQMTDRAVMHTYGRLPLAFVRGEGAGSGTLTGRAYLDFSAASGSTALATAIPGAGGHPGGGRHAAAHLQPLLHPASGGAGRTG